MTEPSPAPEAAAPAPPAKKGVSPVVWIGLAAVLVAGGVYAYAVFVPPPMREDGMVQQTEGESEGDDAANAMPGDPVTPAAADDEPAEAGAETGADDAPAEADAADADAAEEDDAGAAEDEAETAEPVATGE